MSHLRIKRYMSLLLMAILILSTMQVHAFNLSRLQGEASLNLFDCNLYPGEPYSKEFNMSNETNEPCVVNSITLKEDATGWRFAGSTNVDPDKKQAFRNMVNFSLKHKNGQTFFEGSFQNIYENGGKVDLNPKIRLGTEVGNKSIPLIATIYMDSDAKNNTQDLTYKFDIIVNFSGDYEDPPPTVIDPPPPTITSGPHNTPPELELIGKPVYIIYQDQSYEDLGAKAHDKEDGDITHKIVTSINGEIVDDTAIDTSVLGQYNYKYEVKDSKGKEAKPVTRIVAVIPITSKPVITLIGDPYISISQGSIYKDEGAIATDKIDGDITDKMVVTVNKDEEHINTDKLGNNVIRYNVVNSLGIAADEVIRVVEVVPAEEVVSVDEVKLVDTGQRIPLLNYILGIGIIGLGAYLVIRDKRRKRV